MATATLFLREDSELIVSELKNILADIEAGKLVIDDEYEDIHTFVEATLITENRRCR